jgi:hypothetical protein
VLDVGWVTNGGGLRIRYDEGATFWIAATLSDVWLQYAAPLTAADAAHFLLEPVLAFLLRRRGALVLHASAVEVGGHAIAIVGTGGAGKSSLAAAFLTRGAALMTDDVLALTTEGGRWLAQRGTGAVRLWDDAASAYASDLTGVPRFSDTWDKRLFSPPSLGGRDAPGPAPLALLAVLAERGSASARPAVKRLAGHAAFGAVVPHTSANFLHDNERRAEELPQLAALLGAVPVVTVAVPGDPSRAVDAAAALEELVGA